MPFRIALPKRRFFAHSTSWVPEWITFCEENNIPHDLIDFYQNDILDRIKNYDCMMWHFSGYVPQDMKFARSILYACKIRNIRTFPDFNTVWHFDDKVAESYLLQSVGAPVAKSWVFYDRTEALEWTKNFTKFPVVAKLRCGSGSNNVILIKNKAQCRRYIWKMFGSGLKSSPGIFFKAKSNYSSSRSWQERIARMKRAPEFFRGWRLAKQFPRESGYVFFQEFIPNDGYDIKLVVVGEKGSFLTRSVRKNDFRASGGGAFTYQRDLVPDNVPESAFAVAKQLEFKSMGFDYVVDRRDGIGKIVEMSYGFSNNAVIGCGGYWDTYLVWHQEPFNPAREVIRNLVLSCHGGKSFLRSR
jgi:glutathione synthase/RimK-type ligase-like ATP-grasp enzyme